MDRTRVEILHDQCQCVVVLLESRIQSQNDLVYLVVEQLLCLCLTGKGRANLSMLGRESPGGEGEES